MREFTVLLLQHDATVAAGIGAELAVAGIRVAGPVPALEHGIVRAEQQVVAAVLLDIGLPDGQGVEAVARFHDRFPNVPLIVTAPRSAEAEARGTTAGHARYYVLHEEIGRGLIAPLVRECAGGTTPNVGTTSDLRRLLHDLGNLLAAASGGVELVVGRLETTDILGDDIRDVNDTLAESVRVFRQLAASWHSLRSDADAP